MVENSVQTFTWTPLKDTQGKVLSQIRLPRSFYSEGMQIISKVSIPPNTSTIEAMGSLLQEALDVCLAESSIRSVSLFQRSQLPNSSASLEILVAIFEDFCTQFNLQKEHIICVLTDTVSQSDKRDQILRTYLHAQEHLRQSKRLEAIELVLAGQQENNNSSNNNNNNNNFDVKTSPRSSDSEPTESSLVRSALFRLASEQKAGLVAMFGGQGNDWIYDLRHLYQTFPSTRSLINWAAELVATQLQSKAAQPLRSQLWPQGFDLIAWLEETVTVTSDYLSYCPISFPMIGLTQIAQYYTMLHQLGLEPGQMLSYLQGATGHSQGIVAAIVVAASASFSELHFNIEQMLVYLFWHGARIQQQSPIPSATKTNNANNAQQKGEVSKAERPTPMLTVLGIPSKEVQGALLRFNQRLKQAGSDSYLTPEVALVNGPEAVVLAGLPDKLQAFNEILQQALGGGAASGNEANQSRVPFSKRKRNFSTQFLPVSAPFHTSWLSRVPGAVLQDLQRLSIVGWNAEQLRIPVYSTADGSDMRQSEQLMRDLLQMQSVQAVQWEKTLEAAISSKNEITVTHIIDFGTSRGSTGLSSRIIEGQGVQIISAVLSNSSDLVAAKTALYQTQTEQVPWAADWSKDFAPGLRLRSKPKDQSAEDVDEDAEYIVDTKFSRLLGKAPIMVAGMTPTSVSAGFVAAIENAGFHAELAGGGLSRPAMFEKQVHALAQMLLPGQGITLNLLYLNANQFGFQFPMIETLINQGVPIDSVTIAAGIPTREKAQELIQSLQSWGIQYVSFKPGSRDSILQVIEIAQDNPDMTIVVQWTGGRAGGHHSFEDMHAPILETYGRLRRTTNIILLAGSGIGNSQSAWPYLSGSWSLAYRRPAMPFDGVLMGSRMMVAKEAETALEVKQLIVETPGISLEEELLWEKSYEGSIGGVMTVLSELGEPIHKIATRGVKLWAEFDRKYFTLSADDLEKAVQKDKDSIIERLNADYQKVWFGRKVRTGQPCDLEEMTYYDLLSRAIELMFVPARENREGRWLHESYRDRVFDWFVRCEDRFFKGQKGQQRVVLRPCQLNHRPTELLEKMVVQYYKVQRQLLTCDDIDYFVARCERGGKPVNFIPVLDRNFKTWFKKDSLWYSEDLDAVPDRDPQRVCILQGPVAAHFSTVADEPAGLILSNMHRELVRMIMRTHSEKAVSTESQLRKSTINTADISHHLKYTCQRISDRFPSIRISSTLLDSEAHHVIRVRFELAEGGSGSASDSSLPNLDSWLRCIAGPGPSWLHSFLASQYLVQEHNRVRNYPRTLFEPQIGQIVELDFTVIANEVLQAGQLRLKNIEQAAVGAGTYEKTILDLTWMPEENMARLVLHHSSPANVLDSQSKTLSLAFDFAHRPDQSIVFQELTLFKNERIHQFYRDLWNMSDLGVENGLDSRISHTSSITLTKQAIAEFCLSIASPHLRSHHPMHQIEEKLSAPMDMCIVLCWPAMIRCLMTSKVDGNMLQLVHLSNEFTFVPETANPFDSTPLLKLEEGDVIDSKFYLSSVMRQGKHVRLTVRGSLSRGQQTLYLVQSEFLIRNVSGSDIQSFISEDQVYNFDMSQDDWDTLKAKEWFTLERSDSKHEMIEDVPIPSHKSLPVQVRLEVEQKFTQTPKDDQPQLVESRAVGVTVHRKSGKVLGRIAATVDSRRNSHDDKSNPVLEYCQQLGLEVDSPCSLHLQDKTLPSRNRHVTYFPAEQCYNMLAEVDRCFAPASNEPYAVASGDTNAIHVNPWIAKLANLPGCITHGMWTSANGRRVIEQHLARGQPERIRAYRAEFVGMVLPGSELITQLQHIGMRQGRLLVQATTVQWPGGAVVLKATAEIAQPVTAYLFTGQGSAVQGMGMELYDTSAAARSIWDNADECFRYWYGFSILDIVRNNPKKLTIHFGGVKGRERRRNLQSLVQKRRIRTPRGDGSSSEPYSNYEDASSSSSAYYVEVPVFPEITATSTSHTFVHPQGLLFATQFTQPAQCLMELAQFEDLKARGVVPVNAIYAGHSLGEYAALSAFPKVLQVQSLARVSFLRGMTMQMAVSRDSQGKSDYAMLAADPTRVRNPAAGPAGSFDSKDLTRVVELIARESDKVRGRMIQIVNFNIAEKQYVVTGDLVSLDALAKVLQDIKQTPEYAKKNLEEVILTALKESERKALRPGGIVLSRGIATIPLAGIDVPFHSRYLLDGVDAFRELLLDAINPTDIRLERLDGLYIPNVTAVPFRVTKDYVTLTYNATHSPILKQMLSQWPDSPEIEQDADWRQETAYRLVIELFAFQFASPVQWIKTQEAFLRQARAQRIIELGPASTLLNMIKASIAIGVFNDVEIPETLCYVNHADSIYYQLGHQGPSPQEVIEQLAISAAEAMKQEEESRALVAAAAAAPQPVAVAAPVAAPQPVAAAVAAPVVSAAVPGVADSPVSPLFVVRVHTAEKLHQSLAQITPQTSIKKLCGGKSALQNEILGELEQEFGKHVDNASDLSLEQLAQAISAARKSPSEGLGKTSTKKISRLLSNKMPGGISVARVRAYLAQEWRLGSGLTDGVLVCSLTMPPASRLASDAEVWAWVDSVAETYAREAGVPLSKGAAAAAAPVAAQPMMMMLPAAAVAAAPVADAPVSALSVIRTLVAIKLKVGLDQVPAQSSLRKLTGGKSAQQNEIVGDLEKEFGKHIDQAADASLQELAAQAAQAANYSQLGKCTLGLIGRLASNKLAGGITIARLRAYLGEQWHLPAGRVEQVLLATLLAEPAARFKSEEETWSWLDGVAQQVSQQEGVPFSKGSAMAGQAGGMMSMAAGSANTHVTDEKMERLARDQMQAYQEFLNEDSLLSNKLLQDEQQLRLTLEKQHALFVEEHGESYIEGLAPKLDTLKQRWFESYWSLSLQLVTQLFYSFAPNSQEWQEDLERATALLKNRASKRLVAVLEYETKRAAKLGLPELEEAGKKLIAIVTKALPAKAVYCPAAFEQITAPHIEISEEGKIVYKEVLREGQSSYVAYVAAAKQAVAEKKIPPLQVLQAQGTVHTPSESSTKVFLSALHSVAANGISLSGKVALVTGCGSGSIGQELLKLLLRSGATVVATTSSFSTATARQFQQLYEENAAKGSRLVLLPFNQASQIDVLGLVEWIYQEPSLGDVDFIIPFAAFSENGRDVGSIDGRSELAHRMMLTNTVRLVGAVKNAKQKRSIDYRPATVVLPLSPNHGSFGFDGLYAESKLGLEALMYKWASEGMQDYIAIAGAIIGWTRGTGLMNSNNVVAPGIEALGVRTFTPQEMAFNIMGLLHIDMEELSQSTGPVWADFSGGLNILPNLNETIQGLRAEINSRAEQQQQKYQQELQTKARPRRASLVEPGPPANSEGARATVSQTPFPTLPNELRLSELSFLRGMLDPSQVVVVTGFGEVGPFGNARLRWEIEAEGEFSLEGCIELAWIMGFIKYQNNGQDSQGKPLCGWFDAQSGEYVPDVQVKSRYEAKILAHTGVRLIDSSLFDLFYPEKKRFLHGVALQRDLPPFEVESEAEGREFLNQHGEQNVQVYQNQGRWWVQLKKGTVLHIPRAFRMDRFVAGQLPQGWDPKRFGIPQNIVDQVDPVTLFTLVSLGEALTAAGITDAYELYQYIHVSEVGNSVGGALGGMVSLRKTFRDRVFDDAEPVQGDILQETFINTTPAWLNLLLLSSSGPIKTPVAACATAAESLELGLETIRSGKAKMMVVGGFDDIGEESVYEFASMGATSSTDAELRQGREPREMSRPAASSRGGFMESYGAGVQILTTAELALQMGLPIYGILAMTHTATDKCGRSVPAPGKGIMTAAREVPNGQFSSVSAASSSSASSSFAGSMGGGSPLLDIHYRKRQLEREMQYIQDYRQREFDAACQDSRRLTDSEEKAQQFLEERLQFIVQQEERMKRQALSRWSHDFCREDPSISPMRGALSVYGLTVDDIGLASFHGTGTKANDLNEGDVINTQLGHLGRSQGNLLPVVCQKYLTGHPKGGAAAWMLNGVVQSMHSGIIPGNRNLDNVDPHLDEYSFLLYPNQALRIRPTGTKQHIEAAMLTSFGFGQAGAQCLIVHPDYFLASMEPHELESYALRRSQREAKAYRHWQQTITGKRAFLSIKETAPFSEQDEKKVYLDPTARASFDRLSQSYKHQPQNSNNNKAKSSSASLAERLQQVRQVETTLKQMAETMLGPGVGRGIGIDVEAEETFETACQEIQEHLQSSSSFSSSSSAKSNKDSINNAAGVGLAKLIASASSFISRNFTEKEIEYCTAGRNGEALSLKTLRRRFAGRWSAKEAVIKALSSALPSDAPIELDSSGPLKEIEILTTPSGAPQVVLHGRALKISQDLGISEVKTTISHAGGYAVSQAVAQ